MNAICLLNKLKPWRSRNIYVGDSDVNLNGLLKGIKTLDSSIVLWQPQKGKTLLPKSFLWMVIAANRGWYWNSILSLLLSIVHQKTGSVFSPNKFWVKPHQEHTISLSWWLHHGILQVFSDLSWNMILWAWYMISSLVVLLMLPWVRCTFAFKQREFMQNLSNYRLLASSHAPIRSLLGYCPTGLGWLYPPPFCLTSLLSLRTDRFWMLLLWKMKWLQSGLKIKRKKWSLNLI